MQLLDILIFAMIAAFLVYRLRSVLGKRTGNERPPHDPYSTGGAANDTGENEKVVPLPDRSRPDDIPDDAPAAEGLRAIREADPSFSLDEFVEGARAAFEMIVASYAAGDRDTLQPLLSDEVFKNFAGAIDEREAAGQTMEATLIGIRSADVVEAYTEGRVAFVSIKFVSEQIEVTRDSEGEVVSGDPSRVTTVTDIWTFARNTRSRNPNWTLVATETPN